MIYEIRPLTRQDIETARWPELVEYLEAHGHKLTRKESTSTLRAAALAEFDMGTEVAS